MEVNERGAPPPNGIANNSYNNNHIYLNSSLANVGISFNTANAFYAYTNYVYPSASTWFGMQYTNCSVFTDQANTVLGPGTNPTNLFGP